MVHPDSGSSERPPACDRGAFVFLDACHLLIQCAGWDVREPEDPAADPLDEASALHHLQPVWIDPQLPRMVGRQKAMVIERQVSKRCVDPPRRDRRIVAIYPLRTTHLCTSGPHLPSLTAPERIGTSNAATSA